jgi:hypothetical protein
MFVGQDLLAASESKGRVQANVFVTESTVAGMDRLRFFALNGQDKTVDFRFVSADISGKTYTVFSLEDPVNPPVLGGVFPEHLDKDLVQMILAIGAKFSPSEVAQYIGVSPTSNEYVAGIQVAIWNSVNAGSQKYKFEYASLKNSNVSAVADWVIKVSQEALDKKPSEILISRYLFPRPDIFVNTSRAEGVVEGQFNYYGPYVVESKDPSMRINYEGLTDVFSIVNNVSGTVVTELSVNSPFYVRFDKTYISNIEIRFFGESNVPLFFSCTNFIAMIDNSEVSETRLVVGSSNSAGKITYIKTDAETDAFLSGVVAEIRDESGRVVTTITTGFDGVAESPDLLLGKYSVVEINTLPGYKLDDVIHKVELSGSGQVERIVSKGFAAVSFVTFLLTDGASGAPVGGSIFEVSDEAGEVVTKIGFNSTGRCANIELEEDKYFLREIVSDPNYEFIVDKVDFESEAGITTEVKLTKNKAFSKTAFVVKDDKGSLVKNGSLELFRENGDLITSLSTDLEGKVSVSLPSGNYYVKNVGTGGYYGGQTIPFVVDKSSVDKVVEVGVVTYDSSVSGIVCGMDGSPLPNVSLVALDDLGNEYSTDVTDFEGKFELSALPRGSAIFLTVFKAPFGLTGEFAGSNKVIVSGSKAEKNLVIKTLDEVNEGREEVDQLVSWDFYELVNISSVDEGVTSSFGFGEDVQGGDGSERGEDVGDGPGDDPLERIVSESVTTSEVVVSESVTEPEVVTTSEPEVVTTSEPEEESGGLAGLFGGLSGSGIGLIAVVGLVGLFVVFRPKGKKSKKSGRSEKTRPERRERVRPERRPPRRGGGEG